MKNFKKVLLSGMTIGVVAVVALVATNAYFTDEETSTGNTIVAGDIDLKIDNTSYGFDWNDPDATSPIGEWRQNLTNSWESRDLNTCGPTSNLPCLFFDFTDLKPGDYGEDTISVLVNSNDAYACMAMDLTGTPENVITGPEVDADDETEEGELQNYLNFAFWLDDGDNVYEDDEGELLFSGLASELDGEWQAIAQSGDPVLVGGETYYVGKFWCFGTIGLDQQSDNGLTTTGFPTETTTGFTCSGEGDQNDAQTDGIVVDVSFYAVQARGNSQFTCASLNQPTAPRPLIDGVVSAEEWEGCQNIPVESSIGNVCIVSDTDYMYVLYELNDTTDARTQYVNEVGNDQIGLNVNPTDGGSFGFPYDLIFESSALSGGVYDPQDGGHHQLPWNPKVNSGTTADNWASRWFPSDAQQTKPVDLLTATTYTGSQRITEWKLPMTSVSPISGDMLKVGGAVDIGDGNSYIYPSSLIWADPDTFEDIIVN